MGRKPIYATPMSDRERAARHRARRKAIEADGRTAAITLHFTPDEQAEFARHVASQWPEWPKHASLADVMRHEMRLETISGQDAALAKERPDDDPDRQRLDAEWKALLVACTSTTCDCPRVPRSEDGKEWRECVAVNGKHRWSAGRVHGTERTA